MTARSRLRRVRDGVLFAGVAAALLTITGCHSTAAAKLRWAEGEKHGPWTVLYDGYGGVWSEGPDVVLEPKSADSLETTHGGLVFTTHGCEDASFSVTVRTDRKSVV